MCVCIICCVCIDGGCVCVSAYVSERWIMAGVPASSQIHAPKMTFPNFGTKFTFRIDSICWLQREQNRIMPIP